MENRTQVQRSSYGNNHRFICLTCFQREIEMDFGIGFFQAILSLGGNKE
jgi:hypothetical protein